MNALENIAGQTSHKQTPAPTGIIMDLEFTLIALQPTTKGCLEC